MYIYMYIYIYILGQSSWGDSKENDANGNIKVEFSYTNTASLLRESGKKKTENKYDLM